ncbi:hypothetical protein K8W59_03455 [Nocardioides rotundus]|uniref:hypothetical protein n=1 Tax=Nocardioides rotundus TaxID=1774216 RepID=UPI001CBEB1D0|nr:hypothetical protein [Nocardioides rotundus]UAL30591.1 hypothetical protein K8W59_03455 [Nocardioides rotundus]
MPSSTRGRRTSVALIAILVLAAIGAAVGYTLALTLGQTRTATASVLVAPLIGNPYQPEGEGDNLLNVQSEAEVVRSDAVLEGAAARSGLQVPDLRDMLTTTVTDNSQIVTISVAAETGDTATQVTRDVAESFLDFRTERAEQTLTDRSSQLDQQLSDISDRRAELVQEVAASSGIRASLLREEIYSLNTQASALQGELAAMEATPRDPGQVVTVDLAPRGPQTRPEVMAPAVALVMAIPGILLLLRSRRATSVVQRRADFEGVSAPILGEISEEDRDDPENSSAVRDLRNNVLDRSSEHDRVLLLTAALNPPEAADAAPALAEALAQTRRSTLLISLDGATDSAERPGLADVLRGDSALRDCIVRAPGGYDLLAAGTSPESLEDLLVSPRMSDVMRHVGEYDLVLLTSGLRGWDARPPLVRLADAELIEVHSGTSRRQQVDDLVRAEHRDVPVLGLVLRGPRTGTRAAARRRRGPR